jgi:hypothetical protein
MRIASVCIPRATRAKHILLAATTLGLTVRVTQVVLSSFKTSPVHETIMCMVIIIDLLVVAFTWSAILWMKASRGLLRLIIAAWVLALLLPLWLPLASKVAPMWTPERADLLSGEWFGTVGVLSIAVLGVAWFIDEVAFQLVYQRAFRYDPGRVYCIEVSSRAFTNIHLQPGEVIFFERPISPWIAGTTALPTGGERAQTVILSAPPGETHADLTITTNRRSYHLHLVVGDGTYNPTVSWRYPFSPSTSRPRQRGPFGTIPC